MYPLALNSLSDGTVVAGIKKAFLQSWQDEAALMHCASTTTVDHPRLEWMTETLTSSFTVFSGVARTEPSSDLCCLVGKKCHD